MDSSSLRLYDLMLISYHGDIESRMLQIRITRSDTRNVQYESSHTERNKKTLTGCQGFLFTII